MHEVCLSHAVCMGFVASAVLHMSSGHMHWCLPQWLCHLAGCLAAMVTCSSCAIHTLACLQLSSQIQAVLGLMLAPQDPCHRYTVAYIIAPLLPNDVMTPSHLF